MRARGHFVDERIEIRKACVGAWENNVYVVVCVATGESAIVDAAAEPETIARLAEGTAPRMILTTHGHRDHIGAAAEVSAAWRIPILLHPADTALAGLDPDQPITEEAIVVGDVAIEPMHTPGHTPGSVCFRIGGALFSGDTLFPGGPGATVDDTAFGRIMESLESRLFTLDDSTIVLCGHGLDTTIGTERPHLASWRARGW